jgi:hypothetical protein
VLRRAPSAQSRWSLARGAPKSAGCWTPTRSCARCSEERRLPYPGGPVPCQRGRGLWPGEMGGRSSEEVRFPVSVRWGVDPPKRVGSLSRRDGRLDSPTSIEFPVPVRPCARCSEERRLPYPVEAVRAVLRRAPVAVPRWNGGARPPKRAVVPVPVERGSRCSEERRLPGPGGREPCRVGRGRVCEEEDSIR